MIDYSYAIKIHDGRSCLLIEDKSHAGNFITNNMENVVDEICHKEQINPGENEQEARKKFMETYSKSFKKEDEHASPKEIITKVCRRCKEDKPIKRFYRDTRSTDTRESVCIDCREEQKLLGKIKNR